MVEKSKKRHVWRGPAVVLLTTAIVVGIRWTAERRLGEGIPMLLSGLPVLISAYVGGLWPGLMATLLNLLIGIFFVEPIHIFDVDHFADRLRASLFVMEGGIISILCESLHRARGRTQALLEGEREAREQAEEGIRSKDKFLATVSHELRTPLSAIGETPESRRHWLMIC